MAVTRKKLFLLWALMLLTFRFPGAGASNVSSEAFRNMTRDYLNILTMGTYQYFTEIIQDKLLMLKQDADASNATTQCVYDVDALITGISEGYLPALKCELIIDKNNLMIFSIDL